MVGDVAMMLDTAAAAVVVVRLRCAEGSRSRTQGDRLLPHTARCVTAAGWEVADLSPNCYLHSAAVAAAGRPQ